MKLPAPDPLSTILLYLAAIIMALEAALKPGAPLSLALPALTMGSVWPFVPLALLTLAAVIWVVRALLHRPGASSEVRILPPAGEPMSAAQRGWLIYMAMFFFFMCVIALAPALRPAS